MLAGFRLIVRVVIGKTEALLLDSETGLHPAMQSLQPFWGDGTMVMVHNVGYDRSTRSHFEAQDRMERGAARGKKIGSGWLARPTARAEQPEEN